jgi:hypothetical protein
MKDLRPTRVPQRTPLLEQTMLEQTMPEQTKPEQTKLEPLSRRESHRYFHHEHIQSCR